MALSVSAFPEPTPDHPIPPRVNSPRLRTLLFGANTTAANTSDSDLLSHHDSTTATMDSIPPIPLTSPPSHRIPAYVSAISQDEPPTVRAIQRMRSFPSGHPLPRPPLPKSTSSAHTPLGTARRDLPFLPSSSLSRVNSSEVDLPSPPDSPTANIPPHSSTTPNLTSLPTISSAPTKSPPHSIASVRPTITISTSGLSTTPPPPHRQQPTHHHQQQQQPSSQRQPTSRILITNTRVGNPSTQNTINLRYQAMAISDPTGSGGAHPRLAKADQFAASPPRFVPPSGRVRRPKTSPHPKPSMLEAIPNSWASASRPSDLRPSYPPTSQLRAQPPTSQSVGTGGTNNSPSLVSLTMLRARSRSASRNARRAGSVDRHDVAGRRVVGPRPRVAPSQPVQTPPRRLSLGVVMNTTKLVSASPPPTSTPPPATSKAAVATMTLTTRVLPIRSIPTPSASPPAHTATRKPNSRSDFSPLRQGNSPPVQFRSPTSLPSSPLYSRPARPLPAIAITGASASGSTTSPASGALDSPPSPVSLLSYASLEEPRRRTSENDSHYHHNHTLPHEAGPSHQTEFIHRHPNEVQYDDKLLRIPVSPTSTCSSGDPVIEVFVDNQYYDEYERSPSPIVYAKGRGGADSDDEEVFVWNAREGGDRHQQTSHIWVSTSNHQLRKRAGMKHRQTNPSSPLSYHSDDSELLYGQPRRRRRSQLRSYRYLYRPPVLTDGPNDITNAGARNVNGRRRSISPILYAPRRSLDGLRGDHGDEDDGGNRPGWWGGKKDGGRFWEPGGGRGVRRTPQSKSLVYHHVDGDENSRMKDNKERGRRRERTSSSRPGGNNNNKQEKKGERKGSRGILDEIAAVAVNVGGGRRSSRTRSGSRSPKIKQKEKEGQWKRVWMSDKEKERDRSRWTEASGPVMGEPVGMIYNEEVMDIGASPGYLGRRKTKHSLAGLEFA